MFDSVIDISKKAYKKAKKTYKANKIKRKEN